ncbi:MAG: hypothetical protein JNL05_12960 [Flavobacteriales bacterium]|nr:hypothetical protein [Flavobacteriales bacterium]
MARIEKLKGRWKQICASYKGQRVKIVGDHFAAGRTGTHTGAAKFTQNDMGHVVLLDASGTLPPSSIVVWKSWHMEFIN